uniref:Methylosome subunit pICln n=1 Tax=Meloidogyne hapla TaxID=6305 RepID=A0A1I8AZ73_MELHA
MLVLQDLDEPTENVMATENMVVAYWERDCLGQGNLFLTDRQMIWINPTSRKGLRLPVPSIVVHAVSASNESFPEPCLFTLIDTSKAVQDLFATLNKCQELNPEPEEMSEDDNYEDEEYNENGELGNDEEMNGDH